MRTLLAVAILFAACESAALPTVPSPSTSASPTPRPEARIARIWLDDPSVAVNEPRLDVDGDRELLVGVDFTAPPERAFVEGQLARSLPPASGVEWPSDRRLVAHLPPGGPVTVDLSRLSAAPDGPRYLTFVVDRPTYEVALYRPSNLFAGSLTALRTWTLHYALESIVAVAPDGRRVLASHRRGASSDFSLIDLDSGVPSSLSAPFANIAANGFSFFDWLSDGRLLGVGSHASFVGHGDGSDPQEVPALDGQAGVLSPSGTRLLLWSYADHSGAIVDLTARQLRPLAGTFNRCTVGGDVGLTWFGDGQVIVSDCTADLAGDNRTRLLDADSGRVLRTFYGHQVLAVVGNGLQVRATVEPAAAMESPRRQVWLADPSGRRVITLDDRARLLFAPDGTALAYTNASTPQSVVVDTANGRSATLDGVRAMTWTKRGELLVIRRLPD